MRVCELSEVKLQATEVDLMEKLTTVFCSSVGIDFLCLILYSAPPPQVNHERRLKK